MRMIGNVRFFCSLPGQWVSVRPDHCSVCYLRIYFYPSVTASSKMCHGARFCENWIYGCHYTVMSSTSPLNTCAFSISSQGCELYYHLQKTITNKNTRTNSTYYAEPHLYTFTAWVASWGDEFNLEEIGSVIYIKNMLNHKRISREKDVFQSLGLRKRRYGGGHPVNRNVHGSNWVT